MMRTTDVITRALVRLRAFEISVPNAQAKLDKLIVLRDSKLEKVPDPSRGGVLVEYRGAEWHNADAAVRAAQLLLDRTVEARDAARKDLLAAKALLDTI